MRSILSALLIFPPVIFAADDRMPVPKKKFSAISLLPDGSQLHGVMFPRYDKNHHLIGVLKAKVVTLINNETAEGRSIVIEFFNPDGSKRGRADLSKAVFNQAKSILTADEPVTIHTDRISAKGDQLIYAFEQGEGFLTGPVTTWMQAPTETAMTPKPLRTASAAVGVGISLITAQTPPLVAAESASTAAPIIVEGAKSTRSDLRADLEASAAATQAAKEFLEKADIISKSPATNAPPTPEAKPLDVKPGPTDTVIECDGGMYFDADKGVFVYLKNVRVTDPRFNLTGANQLEIHLGKKPEKTPKNPGTAPEKPDEKKAPGMGLGAKFGDVESITASGAVRIIQKEVEAGKQPVQASGALFSYHPKTGQITLSGGYPWVMQGTTFMRAKEPNLTLRIQKSGSFVTEGNWEMGGTLDQKQLKTDSKPNQNR